MEIKFDKEYLEELYLEGKTSDKKHRFQPPIVAKYRKTIDLLESVRVNEQYRIEFKTTKVVSEIVVTVCNIIELSNHYK